MGCGASKRRGQGKSVTILMLGPQDVGKTTILYWLALNNWVTTSPTYGFNVETFVHRGDKVTVWDFGGSPIVRKVWRVYYFQAQGLIFVVDISSTDTFVDARIILQSILTNKDLEGIPMVVMANKNDLEAKLSEKAILEGLGLYDVTDRSCSITSTCAITGEGLRKALDNIVSMSKKWREIKKL